MFRFKIQHKSGITSDFDHIDRVSYLDAGKKTTVEGEDIGTHVFPVTPTLNLCSTSKNCNNIVMVDDISTIEIEREE